MRILNIKQGTEEWKANRAKKRNASEAPAVMGVSKKTSRNELIQMKATGTEKEFSAWVQKNLLDNGHVIEKATRPIAEKIVGEELFPASAEDDDGYLAASYDGLTMMHDICWENKLWNEEKAAIVRQGEVPDEDVWQVKQQLAIGPEKCLYTVSDGTEEKTVHVWVTLDEADRKKLLAGWKQFDEDVQNYVHVERPAEPVGVSPESLPALNIELTGAVTSSNLGEFRATAMKVIDAVNTDLQTDQDFANAEKAVKWCTEVEGNLEAEKKNALKKTADIEKLFRVMDELKEYARDTRLKLNKLVTERKKSLRAEIVLGGRDALAEHITKLNERLGKPYMPPINVDFAAEVKGKRSFDKMRDAVDTALANAKIDANNIADKIELNLKTLREHADGYQTLFSDAGQLVHKENDDLLAVIKSRIAEHKEAEEKRLEAERERIRQEEQVKAEAARENVISPEDASTAADAIEEVLEQDLAAPQNTHPAPTGGTNNKGGDTLRDDIATYLLHNASITQTQAERIASMLVQGKVPWVIVARRAA